MSLDWSNLGSSLIQVDDLDKLDHVSVDEFLQNPSDMNVDSGGGLLASVTHDENIMDRLCSDITQYDGMERLCDSIDKSGDGQLEDDQMDLLEEDVAPQQRSRCNTWPRLTAARR